ncbi:hypothetical protein ABZ816_33720 [Actinosynnema sp. NPDC047251]|uniref:Uncharacterized protein n=1 Tax=Saccharothrix espanaensis (strain ATCC 51144 / DSM 44229 / JCM 9112 / NBRC 15066 / NRRL 15764) TaxID=1179773 RepID=K0K443_SACES|nr:hypothetical protein [Saccharothrix espanaensis]CCH33076.1 hypothetical protein BN6_58180 [Saccharothrix espanaensis DSM 44229]
MALGEALRLLAEYGVGADALAQDDRMAASAWPPLSTVLPAVTRGGVERLFPGDDLDVLVTALSDHLVDGPAAELDDVAGWLERLVDRTPGTERLRAEISALADPLRVLDVEEAAHERNGAPERPL